MERIINKEEAEAEAEAEAQVEILNFIYAFTDIAVIRCAIELGIPDILENQGGIPMSLSDLASSVGCPPSTLYRLMRFLVNRRIFHEEETGIDNPDLSNSSISKKGYVKTPISGLLTKNGPKSMVSSILFQTSPFKLATWVGLSKRVLAADGKYDPFQAANGKDLWSYVEANPGANKLFNEAMASDTRLGCSELFLGLESVVDVGGGNGMTMRMLVEAFPWIHGIVFDIPHVIQHGEKSVNVEYIAGDMFHSIPMADSVVIKWILHDWGDEECIKILRNCREAIPEDKGKVIIVDAVINEDNEIENDSFDSIKITLDMVMMSVTEAGQERTLKQWGFLIDKAGFSRHTVHSIQAVQSVIVAYP